MNISLNDFLDFVVFWLEKRSDVHLNALVVYPAMVRHCLCCHESGNYALHTNGLCRKCGREQVCTMCGEAFAPSQESVGAFCAACWARLQTTWTTTFHDEDPVKAEAEVRALVTAAHPPLVGCRHRRR